MQRSFDVVVIGAGFCGATAARECARAGLETLVLEARDRVGGRTHTTIWHDSITELGGTWVHWTQPHVWAEIERYGIALERTLEPSSVSLLRADGERITIDPTAHGDAMLAAVDQYMDDSHTLFPEPFRPAHTPAACARGHVTAAEPLAEIADPVARDLLDALISTSVGAPTHEAAWLEIVRFYALSGHRYRGMLDALGAYRMRDGSRCLIDAMLSDARAQVQLDAPVASVEEDGSSAIVRTRAGEAYSARAVISTLPLNVLDRVAWSPGLDPRKREACAMRHAGQSTKVVVRVAGTHTTSCLAPGARALSSIVPVHTSGDATHLVGFGPSPALLDVADPQAIARAVETMLPGAQVLASTAWDWNGDPYACGTWCALRPGQYSRHLDALRAPAGRVLFASADWAHGWRGTIDGAIEQGLVAARTARAQLTH